MGHHVQLLLLYTSPVEMLYSLFPICSSHYTYILRHHFSLVSDKIRDELVEVGIQLNDSREGTTFTTN